MQNSKSKIIKISYSPDDILLLNDNNVSQLSDKTDEQILELQNLLTSERKERKVERFFWILSLFILLDCLILPPLTEGVMTLIVLFELIFFMYLAKYYNMEFAVRLFSKIWNRLGVN